MHSSRPVDMPHLYDLVLQNQGLSTSLDEIGDSIESGETHSHGPKTCGCSEASCLIPQTSKVQWGIDWRVPFKMTALFIIGVSLAWFTTSSISHWIRNAHTRESMLGIQKTRHGVFESEPLLHFCQNMPRRSGCYRLPTADLVEL